MVEDWRSSTKWLIALTAVIWATYDAFAYKLAGNDATISKVVLDTARDWPILAVAAGVLVGHFFFPQRKTM